MKDSLQGCRWDLHYERKLEVEPIDEQIRMINSVSHKVTQYLNKQLADLQLTASTYFFILKIGDHGELSQDQLFQLIYLNPSNVTRRLDRLIKLGYVVKQPSVADGRANIIKLTELGQQRYEELKLRLPRINTVIVDRLNPDQLTVFNQLMNAIEINTDQLLNHGND